MKLKEKYEKLKVAALKDASAVRNRRTVFSGVYPKNSSALDGISLLSDIKTAAAIGYETHLRVKNDAIEVYFVANVPSIPWDVLYG